MKKFNINDTIYIQITEGGWKHLNKTVGKDYIVHCIKPYETIINGEIYYKLQLHAVFDLLTAHRGRELLFNTNILIDEKNLTDIISINWLKQ